MSRARDVADGALGTIAGTNGQVLTSDGNNWSSQAVPTELPAYGSDGNILTSTGSAWASEANPLPAHGTSGNVLTSTGSAWASQAAAGGAGWNWLAKNDITSNTSYSTFDNTKVTNAYDNYVVVMNQVKFSATARVTAQIYANGSWQTGDYQFHMAEYAFAAGGGWNLVNTGTNTGAYLQMTYSGSGGTVSTQGTNLVLYFTTRANDNMYRAFSWQGSPVVGQHGGGIILGGGLYRGETSSDISGIRFYDYGGASIMRGEFNLYGLAGS